MYGAFREPDILFIGGDPKDLPKVQGIECHKCGMKAGFHEFDCAFYDREESTNLVPSYVNSSEGRMASVVGVLGFDVQWDDFCASRLGKFEAYCAERMRR
jgi:hypothetical protein